MVKWSEERAINRLNERHLNMHKAISTEGFVGLTMEVTINEDRALENFRNLKSQGLIILHKEKVMLKWYYDAFYNEDWESLRKQFKVS